MINWKVRFKNKAFWIAIIPAVILLVQQVCAIFGLTLDLADLQAQLVAVVGSIFAILSICGIVNDPTTEGLGDSERAKGYVIPYPKHVKDDDEVAELAA